MYISPTGFYCNFQVRNTITPSASRTGLLYLRQVGSYKSQHTRCFSGGFNHVIDTSHHGFRARHEWALSSLMVSLIADNLFSKFDTIERRFSI